MMGVTMDERMGKKGEERKGKRRWKMEDVCLHDI